MNTVTLNSPSKPTHATDIPSARDGPSVPDSAAPLMHHLAPKTQLSRWLAAFNAAGGAPRGGHAEKRVAPLALVKPFGAAGPTHYLSAVFWAAAPGADVESFIEQAANVIQTHQAWAGPVVGLIAFGESLILIGILLPGTAVLVIVGGLVGAGIVEPIPVLIGSAAGAAVGDIVSYFLGRRLGRGVVHKWPLNQYREALARARLFFRRYGIAAVFIGRFFRPVRSTVPFVAGMMRMQRYRFQIANFLSALVWAPVVHSPRWLVAKGEAKFIETDWFPHRGRGHRRSRGGGNSRNPLRSKRPRAPPDQRDAKKRARGMISGRARRWRRE
jgi:membrane protein DedA with SNARE-associated domain